MLKIENLHVAFDGVEVVRGVDYAVSRGEVVSILGESGSGKSVSLMSALRLYQRGVAAVSADKMAFDEIDLMRCNERVLNTLRGKRIGFVFQNPGEALSPNRTIHAQLKELCTVHNIPWEPQSIHALLGEVGLAEEADRLMSMYPHQLSGGQAQRITIAMAILPKPELLIADEPTSAIDASLTGVIIKLLLTIQKKMGLGLLFITHDFELASKISDRIIILYGGLVMESGKKSVIFENPLHPYTIELMRCVESLYHRDQNLYTLKGYALDPSEFSDACPFAARCSEVSKACTLQMPELRTFKDGRQIRCVNRKEI